MDRSCELGPSDALRLVPHATRRLGENLLLVSAGGATRPVERLTGGAAELWSCFAAGLTLSETAATVARRTAVDVASIESQVVAFAEALIRAGWAERAP